jgi:GTP pyrophosphokinase
MNFTQKEMKAAYYPDSDLSLGRQAQQFATYKHQGQLRDDGVNYIFHPAKVAEIISLVSYDEELIAAAWLHDTVEDTETTVQELGEIFGSRVAALVQEVTKEDGKFPNLHSREGVILKFADRLSNLADMKTWSPERQQRYINKSNFWSKELLK